MEKLWVPIDGKSQRTSKYGVTYSRAPYNHISGPFAEVEKPSQETAKVAVGHEGRQRDL